VGSGDQGITGSRYHGIEWISGYVIICAKLCLYQWVMWYVGANLCVCPIEVTGDVK